MLRLLALAAAALLTPALAEPPGDRLVKVYGDLAAADRIAVVVPGCDTTAAAFEAGHHRPGGAARALLAQARAIDPRTRLAVVAWLGYASPRTWSLRALTDSAAAEGARALRRTLAGLPRVPVTLLCHSYGSVVCGLAAPGPPVTDVVALGSPGLGTAAREGSARLWAGRASGDWIRFVPHVKLGPLGFGADPMDPAVGARILATGPGGHSDYFRPGTPSLRNLALIALGRTGEVSRG
ncbi:alpha/beta hydrolase [Thermoactinospora rubra]|uniref:alpha/beta hydrolase n=1 Tax=Thermoactinospora rubra TaxID=1088767 RepID=UPI000A112404|nr:alpha/beta hydrolase [Thermoactinospora rubra]